MKISPSKITFQNCSLKNTWQNCSLKKYIPKLLSQKYISNAVHNNFKVTNHCCCLTKNVARNYLVCQMYMIILINDINNIN